MVHFTRELDRRGRGLPSPLADHIVFASLGCGEHGEIAAGVEVHLVEDDEGESGYAWAWTEYRFGCGGPLGEVGRGLDRTSADARDVALGFFDDEEIEYGEFLRMVLVPGAPPRTRPMASRHAVVDEWACVDLGDGGEVTGGVEVHLSEDEWSPSGYAWDWTLYSFADGRAVEEDGGLFWNYDGADELAREYCDRDMPHGEFMAMVER